MSRRTLILLLLGATCLGQDMSFTRRRVRPIPTTDRFCRRPGGAVLINYVADLGGAGNHTVLTWQFRGTDNVVVPVTAVANPTTELQAYIGGTWRSPTATAISSSSLACTYAFDIKAASDYRIVSRPSGLTFTGAKQLQVPLTGLVVFSSGSNSFPAVTVSGVVKTNATTGTWSFSSNLLTCDSPTVELELKIGGTWRAPTATSVSGGTAVCTYAQDVSTATDWRIVTSPTTPTFANYGGLTAGQSGTPTSAGVTILAVTTDPRNANLARVYYSSAVLFPPSAEDSMKFNGAFANGVFGNPAANMCLVEAAGAVLGTTWSLVDADNPTFADGLAITDFTQTGTVQAITQDTITADGNWTPGATVGVALLGVWGASSGPGVSALGEGGGGGGAHSNQDCIVAPSTAYAAVIGAAGVAGAAGGDSTFISATVLKAKGGAAVSAQTGGVGGASAAGVGTNKYAGGNGADGTATVGGGGGSSAGWAAGGGNASGATGGTAPTGGATGANGGANTVQGTDGNIPGGGPGGSGATASGSVAVRGQAKAAYYAGTLGTPAVTAVAIDSSVKLLFTFSNVLNSPTLNNLASLQGLSGDDDTTWMTPNVRTVTNVNGVPCAVLLQYPSPISTVGLGGINWRIPSGGSHPSSEVPFVGSGTLLPYAGGMAS